MVRIVFILTNSTTQFINILTKNGAVVGHDLGPCTAEVGMVRIDNVVLVDTPGFDNMDTTDNDILSMVADRLTKT